MKELWLTFKDPTGESHRIGVDKLRFVIGRHSECDLSIPDARLSREHLLIERIGIDFAASDLRSSNGTLINGEPLDEKRSLKDGDRLELGGFPVSVEIVSDELPAEAAGTEDAADVGEAGEAAIPANATPGTKEPSSQSPGVSTTVLLLIPMFGIVLLLFAGVLIYVLVSRDSGSRSTIVIATPDESGADDPTEPSPRTDRSGVPTTRPDGIPTTTGPITDGPAVPPQTPSETAAVEESGAKLLRSIAQNDPKAFLTTEQAKRVDARVRQFKGSTALAENINAARKSSKQIADLAAAHNLKPQLIAVAALTKLGNSRGDVLGAARSSAEVLGKLGPQIGSELAEDSLLMIAAFDQGASGETMKMRNMLQDLATKSNESSRTIRSIWFLEREGKITKNEFERALTFLAIGTITQNPKAFGVNAEALTL